MDYDPNSEARSDELLSGSLRNHTLEGDGALTHRQIEDCGRVPVGERTASSHVDGVQPPGAPREDLHETSRQDSLDSDNYFDVTSGFDRCTNYEPIIVDRSLHCSSVRDFSHEVNKLGSQLNIPGWIHELSYENDCNLRSYLHHRVTKGFFIVDEGSDISPYERSNYLSASSGEAFDYINNIVLEELDKGKYVVSSVKPHCTHSIGAVPKKDGTWRPITDCKRPLGSSINSHMESTYRQFCFTSVDNVIEMIEPGDFMASIDIQSAYRSIMVHPSQWMYQGISWQINGVETYLLDTHICFGLKCAIYLPRFPILC